MNEEQTEAFLLDQAESCQVFGDYYLSRSQLVALIKAAHSAGRVDATGQALRRIDEHCDRVKNLTD